MMLAVGCHWRCAVQRCCGQDMAPRTPCCRTAARHDVHCPWHHAATAVEVVQHVKTPCASIAGLRASALAGTSPRRGGGASTRDNVNVSILRRETA